jgi:hypothetical protein
MFEKMDEAFWQDIMETGTLYRVIRWSKGYCVDVFLRYVERSGFRSFRVE